MQTLGRNSPGWAQAATRQRKYSPPSGIASSSGRVLKVGARLRSAFSLRFAGAPGATSVATAATPANLRPVATATILALLLAMSPAAWSGDTTPSAAPDFSLPAREGGEVSLGALEGEVVLINFWATWCGPCREEMPLLEQIYQRYRPLGFTLLGVNVEEDSEGALRWLQQVPVSFPVLFDRESRVSKLYDVTAMPSTVIVDRRGRVRYVHYGYTPGTENVYQDQIRGLIREKS